jgi:hypothetical protein
MEIVLQMDHNNSQQHWSEEGIAKSAVVVDDWMVDGWGPRQLFPSSSPIFLHHQPYFSFL